MSTTGEKIKALRIQKGWSLDTLAELTNTNRSYIWELENRPNKNINMDKFKAVANALGVTVGSLVEVETDPQEEAAEKGFFRKFKKLTVRDQEIIESMIKTLSQAKP